VKYSTAPKGEREMERMQNIKQIRGNFLAIEKVTKRPWKGLVLQCPKDVSKT
jgi:hypothetical protein